MVTSGLFMVALNGVVKHIGSALPAPQVAFLRYLIGVVFFLPMIAPILRAGYSGRIWGLFILRGTGSAAAVGLWFYAMTQIPVAEVSAIGFFSPVLVLVASGLLLGEGISLRRMAVVAVAFVGVLAIVRPGLREVTLGHVAQLGAAGCFALTYLVAKRLAAELAPGVIVAMLTFVTTLVLAPIALLDWQPVTPSQLGWLALAAVFATLGHYTMTLAFKAAPMFATQPVTFLQIIWATLLGVMLFDEALDPWVIVGGALIIGAISVNMRLETARN